MPDGSFLVIAFMYSLVAYFHGHQGSHLIAIRDKRATLNPIVLFPMLVYNWLFLPWAFLVWYGFKTVWWYAVGVVALGWVFRLAWTKLEMRGGLTKSAWAISLIGIPAIPALLIAMVELTLRSTETTSLLEACHRCPV